MPIDYVAFNALGARVTGVLEAETEEEAEEQLWSQGLIVSQLSLRDASSRRLGVSWLPSLSRAKIGDTIAFTRQFETLLRAGVPIHVALRQLRDEAGNAAMRAAINAIARDVENGERFSRALGKHPKVFPPYYLRMMPMAEETGELSRILQDLLRTMERQQNVAAKARAAILTPAISLAIGTIAALILFTFVLPRLVDLLSEFGTELPLATRVLVSIARFSNEWGLYIVGSIVGGVVLTLGYFTGTDGGRRTRDTILLRIPVIGSIVRASSMFDVCSMYALLLDAGVPPVVALRAVTGTIGNIRIREAFVRVGIEITEGQRLGQTLVKYPVIPRLFSETVANGEQAGALSRNLHALADFYEQETERRVQSGTTLIEPLAFVIVGSLIGFVAVAIISGIYSVIPTISQSGRR